MSQSDHVTTEPAPAPQLSLQQALELLPPSLRDTLKSLPEDQLRDFLTQLLQAKQLSYRPLTEEDLMTISAKTKAAQQFGFKEEDITLTWEEVSQESYIAVGAYAGEGEEETLVGFIVGELVAIGEAFQKMGVSMAWLEQENSPFHATDEMLGIYYLGIDFEFRRQGIASTLLDFVKEVAVEARAALMWLQVNENNAPAVKLYDSYGFQKTDEFTKGTNDIHYLFVYELGAKKRKKRRGAKKAKVPDSSAVAGPPDFLVVNGVGEHTAESSQQEVLGGGATTGRGFGKGAGKVQKPARRKRVVRAFAFKNSGDAAAPTAAVLGFRQEEQVPGSEQSCCPMWYPDECFSAATPCYLAKQGAGCLPIVEGKRLEGGQANFHSDGRACAARNAGSDLTCCRCSGTSTRHKQHSLSLRNPAGFGGSRHPGCRQAAWSGTRLGRVLGVI